tara:strand:- start:610 stop:759 length:150 start_codon:yes stop_codon:yes gene_type:complete
MNDELNSNNIENLESNTNREEINYENLIIRLKDISKSIALLEKKHFDKF